MGDGIITQKDLDKIYDEINKPKIKNVDLQSKIRAYVFNNEKVKAAELLVSKGLSIYEADEFIKPIAMEYEIEFLKAKIIELEGIVNYLEDKIEEKEV